MPLTAVMELPSREVDMWLEIFKAESEELEQSKNSNSALSYNNGDDIRNLMRKKANGKGC